MRRRRIIHRSDDNQAAIVKALRAIGCSVDVIGDPLDLLVGYRGVNYLIEIKSSSRAQLRPSQKHFCETWRGQWSRANTIAEALDIVGVRLA